MTRRYERALVAGAARLLPEPRPGGSSSGGGHSGSEGRIMPASRRSERLFRSLSKDRGKRRGDWADYIADRIFSFSVCNSSGLTPFRAGGKPFRSGAFPDGLEWMRLPNRTHLLMFGTSHMSSAHSLLPRLFRSLFSVFNCSILRTCLRHRSSLSARAAAIN